MKFNDYVYERPDFDAAVASYKKLVAAVENAKSADEVVAAVDAHERLLQDFESALTIASIRHTVDTTDKFYSDEEDYATAHTPAVSQAISELLLALLKSPFRAELEKVYPRVLFTNAELEVKTISPEVVGLLAEEGALTVEYQKLQASAKIDFRGEKRTLAQLGVFKIDPDRATRREAFCAEGGFYMDNAEKFDELFDKLVKVRTEIARKLGFKSFVELGYCRRTRNCYDAKMVDAFRAEVKKHLVPMVTALKDDQAKRIGVDKMKFQDDNILFKEGNPRPAGDFDDTYKSGVELYRKMGPQTKEFIDFMDENGLFSLIATEGKAPGGYCTFIPNYHAPFIFSNFNGTAGDVEVFTHEGGHAFAAYVADKNVKLLELGTPTMESAEVHSMSMEFLAWPWIDSFYKERTVDAKLAHLLGALNFIPYGTMVDEFQHIVYERPELTPQQRNEEWAKLEKQYRPYMDFDGIPFYSDGRGWQRQLHIYHYPFYYIDYCLAQTVALEVFAIMQNQGWEAAWNHYYAFLVNAGTMTFTELLAGAKLSSPFEPGAMQVICETVKSYMAKN